MPQEQESREPKFGEGLKAYENELKSQAVAPPPPVQVDREREWKLKELPEYVISSFFKLAKELFYELPVSSFKKGFEVGEKPEEFIKDVKSLAIPSIAKETAKTVAMMPLQRYMNGEWKFDIAGTVLDATAAVSVLGGTFTTAGKMLRMTSGVGKVAEGLEATGRAGRIAKAGDRLIQIGEAIRESPGKYARIAIDKGAMKLTGGKVDLPKWRAVHQEIKRPEVGRGIVLIDRDMNSFRKVAGSFTEGEAARYNRYNVLGIPAGDVGKYPKVERALVVGRRIAKISELVYGKRSALSPAAVAKAQITRAAIELQTLKPSLKRPKAVALAKVIIDRAAVKPFYRPNVFEKGAKAVTLDELGSDMISGGKWVREGKVGALEKLTGQKGYSKDPRVYVPKMIAATRNAETKLRIIEQLLERKDLITAPAGSKFSGLSKESLPTGFLQKYFKDRIRAQSLESITDPTAQRFLLREYLDRNPKAMLRVVDWINRKLSSLYTVFNPSWVPGQYISNAFLSTVMGADLKGFTLALKGALPAEVMARPGMAELVRSFGVKGFIQSVADTAGRAGNIADMFGRAGVLTLESVNRLKRAGLASEVSLKDLETLMAAPVQIGNIQVKNQLLREGILRTNAASIRLEKELVSLSGRIVKTKDYTTRSVLSQEWAMKKYQQNQYVSDILNDMRKSGELERRIPELVPYKDIVTQSVNRANAAFGEYLGLSAFEEKFFRRLWLFYPWSKAMTLLAFKLPFIAPGRSFMWHQLGKSMMTMTEDQELPEWYRERIPVFALADGRIGWIKVSRWSPFGGIGVSHVANIPYPNVYDPFSKIPVLAMAVKLTGMKTEFDTGLIPYGTQAVNVWDGSINEFAHDGMIVKKIQQPPLVASLLHMLPQTQWVEHILAPYYSKKYDVLGIPHPALDPQGNPKYPIELRDTVAAMLGIGLNTRSREDILKSQAITVRRAIMDYRKSYRNADPEERAMIMQVLRDYSSGKYRRLGRD